jgi:hypothetical protein
MKITHYRQEMAMAFKEQSNLGSPVMIYVERRAIDTLHF